MSDLPRHRTDAPGGSLSVEREQDGKQANLSVSGELDVGTGRTLLDAVEVALARGAREIEVDLTGVSFVDSSGMSSLVAAAGRVDRHGGTIATKAPSGHEARVLLDLAGLDGVVGLKPPA